MVHALELCMSGACVGLVHVLEWCMGWSGACVGVVHVL